jgi:monoamine oxidase
VEDVDKEPGEVFYFFNGQHYSEAAVVDEYRSFVATMRDDLRLLSNEPTADAHSEFDVALDSLSLAEYLDLRRAGPLIKAVVEQAYKAEYGLEIAQQSCLNFLLFIHADRRSKFTPFGVFSDERYHVVDGNDRIVEGLRARLSGRIELGMKLIRVLKTTGVGSSSPLRRAPQPSTSYSTRSCWRCRLQPYAKSNSMPAWRCRIGRSMPFTHSATEPMAK